MVRKSSAQRTLIRTLLMSLLLMLAAYGLFLRTHYSLDTYSLYTTGNAAPQHLIQSRYVTAALSTLLAWLGIHPADWMIPFTAVLIVTMAFCHTRLTFTAHQAAAQGGRSLPLPLVWLACLSAFINVFIEEWYLYPEYTLYYSVALITAMEGMLLMQRSGCWYHWLGALVLFQISLFTYQSTMAVFLIWHLVLTLLRHGFIITRQTMKELALGVLVTGAACVILLVTQRLVGLSGTRNATLDIQQILFNLQKVWDAQSILWYSQRKLWPGGVLPVLCAVLGGVLALSLHRTGRMRHALVLLLVLLMCIVLPFVPHFITASVWLAQRTLIGMWSFFAGSGLVLLALNHDRRILQAVTALVMAAMLIINGVYIWKIGLEHFRVNEMDEAYMLDVQSRIEAYEAQSGLTVTHVATCRDEHFTYAYEGVQFWGHDTNKRCVSVTWADVFALNHYTGEKYKTMKIPQEVYDAHFGGRDWTEYVPQEQLVFDGTTLYLCFW